MVVAKQQLVLLHRRRVEKAWLSPPSDGSPHPEWRSCSLDWDMSSTTPLLGPLAVMCTECTSATAAAQPKMAKWAIANDLWMGALPAIFRKLNFLEMVAICPVRVCRRATFVHSAHGKCRALRQPVALGNALVVPCQSLGSGAARWAEGGVRVPLSAERARAMMAGCGE